MWLIRYLLFFASAIVSVLGAAAVIAGLVLIYIFNRLLPGAIASFLTEAFGPLKALPYQLAVIGTIVCLSTLLGACGPVVGGNVGKWLLITYTIELMIFVTLNIIVASVLHIGHQKSSGAVASPLVMNSAADPGLTANYDEKLYDQVTANTLEKPYVLKKPRDIFTSIAGSVSGKIKAGTNFVTDTVSGGMEMVGGAAGTLTAGAKMGIEIVNLVLATGKAILSMFQELTSEEEHAVRWIRPILGMYTGPIFRLTKSKLVMTAWAIAIWIEIVFMVLYIYLTTVKIRAYEALVTNIVC